MFFTDQKKKELINVEETTPTFGNMRRNEKGRRRPEVYREEEGEQEDLAMIGERENDDDDNLKS